MVFLRQFNQTGNNFNDASASGNLEERLRSGDFLQMNAALTTVTGQFEGYLRQVGEMQPPATVPEAAELKIAEQRAANRSLQLIQRLRSAIQAGNAAEVQQLAQQLDALAQDSEMNRPRQLMEGLLARFNIPDAEVNYRRQ